MLFRSALATSAAPTYFPICDIELLDKQYIDGGLWANNPTFVGLIEALCHFVGNGKEYNSIQILSIGSLDNSKGNPIRRNKRRSALRWNKELLEPFFSGQSHFIHNSLTLLQQYSDLNIDYVRIPSTNLNAKQQRQVGMDKVSAECLRFMRGQGKTQADLWYRKDIIKNFFSTEKTYLMK